MLVTMLILITSMTSSVSPNRVDAGAADSEPETSRTSFDPKRCRRISIWRFSSIHILSTSIWSTRRCLGVTGPSWRAGPGQRRATFVIAHNARRHPDETHN